MLTMDFFKATFIKFIQSFKSPKVLFGIAFCVNLVLLLLFNSTFNTYLNPELNILKIFLIFNLFFLTELTYLIISQYNIKTAFLYSFTTNYSICAFYYLIQEQMIKFCNNLVEADMCCFFNNWLPSDLRIYVVRSTWIEFILIFLLISAFFKIILFKMFNNKSSIFDFLLINITFLVFYFSLSDTYLLLKESINTYYNNKLYSEETYKVLQNHYCIISNQINSDEVKLHKNYLENKKDLYSKPNNLLSKILDLFITQKNIQAKSTIAKKINLFNTNYSDFFNISVNENWIYEAIEYLIKNKNIEDVKLDDIKKRNLTRHECVILIAKLFNQKLKAYEIKLMEKLLLYFSTEISLLYYDYEILTDEVKVIITDPQKLHEMKLDIEELKKRKW